LNVTDLLHCPLQNQTLDDTAISHPTLFCEGPQPMETQPCPNCTAPSTSSCSFSTWSDWTKCSASCNLPGVQYRRQLCTCPGNSSTCTSSYSDSLCVGVPQTETRSCNISCCQWTFIDNWSECITENSCCGNGTQWRRPTCQCNGATASDSECTFAGLPPLNQTRVCHLLHAVNWVPLR
jgi:hypothetical protein